MSSNKILLEKFLHDHTSEALLLLEQYDGHDLAEFLESLPMDTAAELLKQMDPSKAVDTLTKLGEKKSTKLIHHIPINRAELLLRKMNTSFRETVMEGLKDSTSKLLHRKLQYPRDMVGAYLDATVFTLDVDLKVAEGLKNLRKSKDPVYSHIYVVEKDQILAGDIATVDLIKARDNQAIRAIMNDHPPKILDEINIQFLSKGGAWNENYTALPVVDSKDTFLGVLPRETLKQISQKEKPFNRQANIAGKALGDLYRIGLTGLIQSAGQLPIKSES